MQDFKNGKCLRVPDKCIDADGHQTRVSLEIQDTNNTAQDSGPCDRRSGIVGYQVRLAEVGGHDYRRDAPGW